MASKNSYSTRELDIKLLYIRQQGLFDRLAVYQNNLNDLLLQKAKIGILVPISILNEIRDIEQEIKLIQRELDELQGELTAIAAVMPVEQGSQQNKLGARFTIANVEFEVVAPFPFVGLISTMTPSGSMETKAHFAGGFEVISVTQPGRKDLSVSFFRHGRRMSPEVDERQHKLVLPPGLSVLVSGLVANSKQSETTESVISRRITDGFWVIISPGSPQSTNLVVEWPQEHSGDFSTSRIAYEGGCELWVTQPPQGTPVRVWFYVGDRLVAPIVNETLRTLAFPSTATEEE